MRRWSRFLRNDHNLRQEMKVRDTYELRLRITRKQHELIEREIRRIEAQTGIPVTVPQWVYAKLRSLIDDLE